VKIGLPSVGDFLLQIQTGILIQCLDSMKGAIGYSRNSIINECQHETLVESLMLLKGLENVINIDLIGIYLDIFGQIGALVGFDDHRFWIFGCELVSG